VGVLAFVNSITTPEDDGDDAQEVREAERPKNANTMATRTAATIRTIRRGEALVLLVRAGSIQGGS
jgi:hypothetical protein